MRVPNQDSLEGTETVGRLSIDRHPQHDVPKIFKRGHGNQHLTNFRYRRHLHQWLRLLRRYKGGGGGCPSLFLSPSAFLPLWFGSLRLLCLSVSVSLFHSIKGGNCCLSLFPSPSASLVSLSVLSVSYVCLLSLSLSCHLSLTWPAAPYLMRSSGNRPA